MNIDPTGEETSPSYQKRVIEEATFSYSPRRKVFVNQIKAIEDQGEKQTIALEEYRKRLAKSSGEKEPLKFLKEKEILKELSTEKIGEIQV